MRTLVMLCLLAVLSLPMLASAGTRRPAPEVINPCVPTTGTQPVIPEPSSVLLFTVGVAIVGGAAWKRSRK